MKCRTKPIELEGGDLVKINGKEYKIVKRTGKKPWLKRIWKE